MPTVAQQIQTLRDQVEIAKTRRTEASTAQKTATKQLDGIDDEIRALGYNPEMTDDELATIEAKVQADLATALALVTEEIAALDRVLAAAKAAGVL